MRKIHTDKVHPVKVHPVKTHPVKTHPVKTHPVKTHLVKTHLVSITQMITQGVADRGVRKKAPAEGRSTDKKAPSRGVAHNEKTPNVGERGGGIFGMLLAAILGLLVIAAVVGIYQSVSNYFKTTSLITTIAVVKGKIDSTFALQGSFTQDDANLVPALNAMNAWPSGVLVGAVPTHPWDGIIEVIGSAGSDAGVYRIRLNGLPDEQCIDVAQKFATGTSNSGALNALTINTNVIPAPYSVGTISTRCGNDDNNIVDLDFTL